MSRYILALFVALALLATTACATRYNCNMPNEEYQCGSACQTTCENLGQPCPIINIRCNDGCYCKDGYARNSRGICIPIESCPCRRPRPINRRPRLTTPRPLVGRGSQDSPIFYSVDRYNI